MGQSYDSVFGDLSSPYEECRAEAVAIYLSLESYILEIFGHETSQEQNDINYVNWFTMALSGLRGLEAYSVDANKWLQAHSRARYVILRMLLETAPGLVTIKETVNQDDQKPDLLVTLNRYAHVDSVACNPILNQYRCLVDSFNACNRSFCRSEIQKSGKQAAKNFLIKMQVFKSLADIDGASKMFNAYSEVAPGSEFARWRDIVIARKKPRTILVQSNTRLDASSEFMVELLQMRLTPESTESRFLAIRITKASRTVDCNSHVFISANEVELVTYPNSPHGFAQAWIDRWTDVESLYSSIRALYDKDTKNFPLEKN